MPDADKVALVPSNWADFYEDTLIPAGIHVGELLYLSGHTGTFDDGTFSDDMETQIRQTFRNIATTLAEAGAAWSDVVRIDSYHVGLRAQSGALMKVAQEFLEQPFPAWTAVGVTELFEDEALVEISCTAILPPP